MAAAYKEPDEKGAHGKAGYDADYDPDGGDGVEWRWAGVDGIGDVDVDGSVVGVGGCGGRGDDGWEFGRDPADGGEGSGIGLRRDQIFNDQLYRVAVDDRSVDGRHGSK